MLVAGNNPVLSFMLEILASAPKKSDFLATLAELGSLRRGEERIEQYLARMYQTSCEICGKEIQPQAYIWRRGEKTPEAKIYHCPNCGDQGERKTTEKDIEHLTSFGKDTLHRTRAAERVRIGEGPIEPAAEEALQAYLPRQLDFLFTVINKIEGLSLSKDHRRLLTALTLSACDEGSALWTWPNVRSRPRQLGIPPQYRENNLWLALENAIPAWTLQKEPVPLTTWPVIPPPGGGICLIPGRIHSIGALPETIRPYAALGAVPRPNQAFWTLCAVWGGWIWGKEAAQPLKKALERRRYDWNWHTAALHATMSRLYGMVPPDFPFFGILCELVPGFLSAAVAGGEAAGFHLESLAVLEDEQMAQISWKTRSNPPRSKASLSGVAPIYRESIRNALLERNQPASYTLLLASSLSGLAQADLLSPRTSAVEADILSQIIQPFERVLNDASFLKRYSEKSQSIENGSWWLQSPDPPGGLTLSDQVEIEVVRTLQKVSSCTLREIQANLYPRFPGLKTPSTGLIQACLESYGEADPSAPGRWQLRGSERPAQRRKDIAEIRAGLKQLGDQFHFNSQESEETLEWTDPSGNRAFRFFIFASSIISRCLLKYVPDDTLHNVLVIPGSRSNLLAFKLQENPYLREILQKGWHFLKFRHLRKMMERENLTLDLFLELLEQDQPLWEEPTQMTFF